MTWLAGFERIPNDKAAGGTYEDGVPWRIVFHTTEAVPSNIAGARAMAARHPNPPHLWVWPEWDWKAQTVPLNRSSFALLHPAGTPQTNKMRALQIEIIGRAAETPGWPDVRWAWLGVEVVRPIIAAGYRVDLDQVAATTGQDGYGTGGAVRMTRIRWRSFAGIASHSNVPDNHHWDIGDGRLDLIARAAKPNPPPPPPPLEDDDMRLIVKGDKPEWYITDGITKRWVDDRAEAALLVVGGLAKWDSKANGGKGGAIRYPQEQLDDIVEVKA